MTTQTVDPVPAELEATMHRIAPHATTLQKLNQARRMISAASRHAGATVLVRGTAFQVLPVNPHADPFGHPDSRSRLYFGTGQYRGEVSVAQIASGIVDVAVPWQF